METGLRWEDWRSYEDSVIRLDAPVAGATVISEPKDWRATLAFNVGGSYRLNDRLTLLGGYLYGRNAVPDATFEPSVPDSDTHLFCLGAEVKLDRVTLGLAYAYQRQEERHKDNAVGSTLGGTANGAYNSDIHLFGISARRAF